MAYVVRSAHIDDTIVEECDVEDACHHKLCLFRQRHVPDFFGHKNEERPDEVRGDNDEVTEGCLNDVADTCHVLVVDLANWSGLTSILSFYRLIVVEGVLLEAIHITIAILNLVLAEAVESACSGYCRINIQLMALAGHLQRIKLLEGQAEKLILIDETEELLAVCQGRLLHEANNLHPFQQDGGAEEEHTSEAEEEESDNRSPEGVLLGGDLSIVKLDVGGVLGAFHFEGVITELELLQIEAGINSRIFPKRDPHVVWRVYLIKLLVFDLS